ncbi:hypothetical protein IEQ34_000371 [Dendrobium chrysotoxum]|uniref:PWWP domain-containing protein n=1 Tax=Dendrobium chrysotoxum TaxID=161865 RepID=A0AAV7HSP8_DENCH|nr:hypothetical protein IEQ34_000371 [Dendrobium chrysotoxum]
MDEEDDSTLSNLFKSRLRRASAHADHSVHSSAAKRRHSMNRKAVEKSQRGKGMKSSALQSLAIGDLVWAKTSPVTWRPSKVKGFRGPLISILFFGSNKTRWFNSSDILPFEETYPRMVRRVKAKLSYEIDFALDELERNTAVGLKCCCSVSAADDDGSLAVKRGFNPQEISCFVLDKAVSPQVVEDEIATVVRVSAALNAFRYGVVVCNTSEVDEGFCAEGVLDFVLHMAVNRRVDDKAVAQLYAFRRFTSVKPAWFYQLDWEFEDDSLESRTIEDCTSEDELYHGRTREPEVDVSIKPQEECDLLDVNFKQEVREMCVINMVDFTILDTDKKHESLIYNQHQMDMDGGQSAGRDTYRNTREGRILHSCTEDASLMSEIDANITSSNAICASVHSELVSSSHNIQVGEEVTSYRSILPNIEKTAGEGDTSMPVHSDKCNPAEIKSSAENLSLRTVPLYRGQLHSLPINKCSVFSPIEVLNFAIKPQSSPEVCFNTSNAAQCIASIPEMAPFAETALHISANTRKISEPLSFENYKSPRTSLPCSETISPSATLVCESKSAIKFQVSNQNHPRHASRPHSRNQQHNRHLESNSKAFYISPLVRNGLRSTKTRLKSLDDNSHRKSSVLLNMKFPMDYTLPTKEQLEKKFSVFGPLDHTRTKVFFYTGVGQVVFLHQADAVVAYKYLTRKKIFGQANVRFWFYKYENCGTGSSNLSGAVHSSLNLKSCLEKSCTPELVDNTKNCRVRYTV